jgi:hypothetical protein
MTRLKNPARYEAIFYDGKGEPTMKVISRTEMLKIRESDFALFISIPTSILSVQPASGPRKRLRSTWPGLGESTLSVLQALMIEPGLFQTAEDLIAATGNENLREPNNLSACVRHLRVALGDEAKKLIQTRSTRPLAFCWNPEMSYCWIERIPSSSPSAAPLASAAKP